MTSCYVTKHAVRSELKVGFAVVTTVSTAHVLKLVVYSTPPDYYRCQHSEVQRFIIEYSHNYLIRQNISFSTNQWCFHKLLIRGTVVVGHSTAAGEMVEALAPTGGCGKAIPLSRSTL